MTDNPRQKNKRGRPRDATLAQRRRDEILRAATAIFSNRGFRNTDVQEIADLVGVGKGTIYRYYASKEDLFLAAVDTGIQGLIQAINTPSSSRALYATCSINGWFGTCIARKRM